MSTLGRTIREWWHVLGGVVIVVLALGKLYWDVEHLKSGDDRVLLQRLEVVEKRTNDEALIDWNRWRADLEGRVSRLEAKQP